MDAKELKTLRYGAEITQAVAAKLCNVTYGTFQKYEQGSTLIPDEVGDRMRTALLKVQKQMPIGDSTEALRVALGEAVIMLTEAQREELYRKAGRSLVMDAAARVAMNRINGTLAAEIEKNEREIRQLKQSLGDVQMAVVNSRKRPESVLP